LADERPRVKVKKRGTRKLIPPEKVQMSGVKKDELGVREIEPFPSEK